MAEAVELEAQPSVAPDRGEIIAAVLVGGIGVTQVVAMPLLANLVAEAHQVSGGDSGLVGLGNLLGTAVGSLLVTMWLGRLSIRTTSFLAAILACAAQFTVALMPSFYGAVAMEALAGFGAGILLAVSAAIIGASSNADRGFAFILTLQAVIAVFVLLGIPAFANVSTLVPVVAFLAAVQALLIPVTWMLKEDPLAADSQVDSAANNSVFHPAIVLKASSYFIFSAAVGILWVFSGVLGSLAGLLDGVIGQALAVGNVAAIAGSLLAALITSRFGRVGPVLLVCVTVVVSVVLFSEHMGVGAFYAASSLFLFAWGGGLPLMMGMVAEVDPTEKMTSLLPVLAFAGMGIGPALVSVISEDHGLFQQVSATTIALAVFSFILFLAAHTLWRGSVYRHS